MRQLQPFENNILAPATVRSSLAKLPQQSLTIEVPRLKALAESLLPPGQPGMAWGGAEKNPSSEGSTMEPTSES